MWKVKKPCADKNSLLELLHLIIPPKPILRISHKEFLTESELFKLVGQYFSDTWNFPQSQINDLVGKDGSWGSTKQKGKKDIRIRGRTYYVVEANLRAFKWKDISNISQFRYLVRTTQPYYVSIGYVRKLNTTKSSIAKQKSLSLQAYKLKTKNLCKHIFSSIDTNADTLINDRDCKNKKNEIKIQNTHGDCQG